MPSIDELTGQSIAHRIVTLVRNSRFNRLAYLDDGLVSQEPLVGFADAYDPLSTSSKAWWVRPISAPWKPGAKPSPALPSRRN